MAAVGEQHAMSGDQLFDALGRTVEALRQRRDLVATLDSHARAEVVAELLDAGLQALEPPTKPAHDGIGADGDRERHQGQESRDPECRVGALAYLAGDQPTAIRKLQGEVRPTGTAPPAL